MGTSIKQLPAVAPVEQAVRRVTLARRVPMQQKVSLALLTLLIGAVGCCGLVFYTITRNIVRQNLQNQITSLAYGLASTMGGAFTKDPKLLTRELTQQKQIAGLDFIALSSSKQDWVASYCANLDAWQGYQQFEADTRPLFASRVGTLQELGGTKSGTAVVVVPIMEEEETAAGAEELRAPRVLGYLHLAIATKPTYDRLRALHVTILMTCMVVVMLVIPLATLLTRHVVVPIQELGTAARRFAAGNLYRRVHVNRADEIGDLADAFNAMADTVQRQQDDIRRINAGLEEKVRERTEELEKLNGRLHAEISEKEDFLRAVSHDLNAPLRNIAGMASMLILKYRGSLEADALQRLERIQKNVETECELIGELLELSRIKTRREKIEQVDLHELLLSVSDQFSSDLELHGVKFIIENRLPTMRCEKSRMRQVFQNLVDNGIKYMRLESARELRVSCEQRGSDHVLKFTDTGMGIGEEDLPNLFRVFRRAKNPAVMKIPGKGVGLASVKSIMENYGGRLWVESKLGVGTEFYMGIPSTFFQTLEREAAA